MQRITTVGLVGSLLILLTSCSGGAKSGIAPAPQMEQPAQSTGLAQNVPPELSAKLMAELKRVLAARGISLDANGNPVGKAVSSVPKREYRFPDRNDDIANVQVDLSWTHYMQGDYDFNGEVNVSDLTPIGVYYGATSASPNWAQAQRADGDGNGEVNIADVTPIGQNFGAKLAGYVVQWKYMVNDDWTDYGFAPFDATQVQQSGGKLSYAAPSALLADDFRVCPVPDTREFHWTNYQLDDNQSTYYDAVLHVHNGIPGIAFIDDGNGDLYYGEAKVPHPASAADWHLAPLETGDVEPQPPGLQYVADQPAICYVVTDPSFAYDLKYLRVTAFDSNVTWVAHVIASTVPQSPPAFVVKDDLPVVGYGGGTTYFLYFSTLSVPTDASDWNSVDTGQKSSSDSIALVADWVDLASLQFQGTNQVGFTRSLSSFPSGPADFQTYNVEGIPGLDPPSLSMCAVGGLPNIVVSNIDASTLDFLSPTVLDPSSMAMWTPSQAYSGSTDTSSPQLILVDGRPAVCFGRFHLYFAWANSEAPQQESDWMVASQVEGDVNYNSYPPSIVEVEGLPIIAYTQYNADDSSRHVYLAVASEK